MRKRAQAKLFISNGRLTFVVFAVVCVFCAVFVKLYYLHVEKSEASMEVVEKARKKLDKIDARRGDIVDSKNNIMATSRPVMTLAVDPERTRLDVDAENLKRIATLSNVNYAEFIRLCTPHQDAKKIEEVKKGLSPKDIERVKSFARKANMTYDEFIRKCVTTPNNQDTVPQRERYLEKNPKALDEASKIFNVPLDEMKRNFVSFSPRWRKIADNLDDATVSEIMAMEAKGFRKERKYIRVYPSGQLSSHVVGFVNKEFVPELGIERQFDFYLKGQDGWIESEIDGNKTELAQFRSRDVNPTDGMNIETSIDLVIQKMAQDEVRNIVSKYSPKGVSIIVSEPSTGYVIAMANYPNFDPNEYGKADQDSLRNRAICDQYEPGSTFKIVPIAAALNESLVGPDDVFDCNAQTATYKGRVLRLPKEAHTMDKLSVRDITKKSSNKGAAQLGILLGEKKLYEYADAFGFGKKTNIGIVGEIAGTLHKVNQWDGLMITRIPMGHAVAATPLQVHCAMSVIANQGIYMQPQLVKRIYDKNGNTSVSYMPKAVRRVITPKIATLMSEMLTEVVSDSGTAKNAMLKGFKVAGKTGTTQKIINGVYSTRDHVASFSGFFPAQRPRLAITVVIDSPNMRGVGYGGIVAAPSFKNIAEQAANYLGIQSDEEFEKKVAWKGF